MNDIGTISRMLSDRAQSVAEHLLPGGRKVGQEWRAGSLAGDKGQSFGVHLTGAKAGVWSDFQASETGADLIDLWKAVKGCTLVEALDEARAWLGVSRPIAEREPRPSYTRPPKPKCTSPTPTVLDYLRQERNLPDSVIEKYKIAANGDEIIFPFLLPDGTLALAKSRKAVAGAKPVPTAANCEPICMGWHAIPADARMVVICEGEIDALSMAAYGYPALSVPFGGGKGAKQKWIENDFERFDRFDRIILALDMDQVGEEAAEEIAGRLGRHRCFRLKLPHKDANECLVAGVAKAEMDQLVEAADSLDPEGLQQPSYYADRVAKLFWPEPGEHQGYSSPYRKIKGKLYFRPGDLTLWTGASGAGKSQVICDCIPNWIAEGARICIASFEMPPAQTLRRIVKQAGNVDRPTRQYVERILAFLDTGLLVYEKVGKSGVEPLLEIFDYARAKYGCDMFVIDSLLRLGIASDDYAGQEKAVFAIVDWTVKHAVHTHLVAHARKGSKGDGPPEIEDVKGASEIGANAANILTFWRNRDHEDRLAKAKTDAERAELDEKPGVIMNIAKQRHGDFEGKIGLWFDQKTYRYHSSHDRGLWDRRYIDDRQAAATETEF